jgi:hypothetical protein
VIIDRTSPRILTTLALLACGASLIARRFDGLYWPAGLLNACVFLLVGDGRRHRAAPWR